MKRSLLLVLCCLSASAQEDFSRGSYSARATPISLIEALANGSEFEGWSVEIRGIAFFDSENALLFASADARTMFDTASSIQLDVFDDLDRLGFSREELRSISGRYVVVQGIYEHVIREKREAKDIVIGTEYGGALREINLLRVLDASK